MRFVHLRLDADVVQLDPDDLFIDGVELHLRPAASRRRLDRLLARGGATIGGTGCEEHRSLEEGTC
jgi:hypothetical protein